MMTMTLLELFEINPFLTILGIVVVVLIIRFLLRTEKTDTGVQNQEPVKTAQSVAAAGAPPQHIAAITAAVNEYRKAESQK